MKIFIVEDDQGWRSYYQRLLKAYDCCFFGDGIAAMEALGDEAEEGLPDLMILDLLLKGPTGFAILNEMQSYPALAKIPVVVVSSVALPEADAAALAQYSVYACLDKATMTPANLLSLVRRFEKVGAPR